MPCYSNENLFFTTDIDVSLLIAVNKVGLIPLPSHPGFPSNAILTEVSYSWATPARKKQLLLLLPLSSHYSNKKLRATVFIGIQNRLQDHCCCVT